MNLKLIAIAAAAASLSGVAHADLTSGSAVNNGSVTLLAVDITTNNWYIRDTSFLLNSFLPSSVTTLSGDGGVTGTRTPEAGLTLNAANTASFADASFSSWVGAQTSASNIRWIMSGYDNSGLAATNVRRMLASSANAAETILNSNVDSFVTTGQAGGLSGFFNPSSNEFSVTGTGGAAGFLTAWGLGADAMAMLDQGVSLFYAARSTPTGSTSTSANVTRFGNSAGFATVTLESDGDFSYVLQPAVAAVPLPAAAWMLGAGLMALGGAARRRKAAAQA